MNNPTMDRTLLESHLSLNMLKKRHTWMKTNKEDPFMLAISMTSTADLIQVKSASNSIQKKTDNKNLTKMLTFEGDTHEVMIILKEKCILGPMQSRVDGDFEKTMKQVLAEDSSQE
ncbi:hypothetical protein M9458_038141, partial [Cirrhinus mrigala]